MATQIDHPRLGPSVEIADDRKRSRANLLFGLACMCMGPIGVMWGVGDLESGSTLLGLAFVGGSAFLFAYGIWLAFLSLRRLRHRVALFVGRDGFQPGWGDAVGWEEVAAVSDPVAPSGEPRIVRVQLLDPEDYARRHGLGPLARHMLRVRGNDLFLGGDMGMPVAEVETLMRRRLAEYRRSAAGESKPPDPQTANRTPVTRDDGKRRGKGTRGSRR